MLYEIVKYPNRKLYSSLLGSYVNFTDLKNILDSGSEITVTDSEGKNVTKEIIHGVAKKHGLAKEILLEYI